MSQDRKQLIRQYKQAGREMGIFRIRNRANGKVFIGNAQDLRGIINSNKFQLKRGTHFNKELQEDYDTFGEESFDFDILDILKPREDQDSNYPEELRTLESMWLEKLQPYREKGYMQLPHLPAKESVRTGLSKK
jgi:hypothetical protein